jgi:phage repressor protein C with HTH and peptisase S24 domain
MAEGGNIVTPPRPISAYLPEDPVSEDEVEVPVLNLKLSAGRGNIQWEIDQTGRRHRYDKRWIDNLGIREPEKLTTVRVEGDSMWPGIPDSSSVVLYTGPLNLRNGEVYAIDYLNEFFIKRLYKDPDGYIRIVSDNPDKSRYADIRVAPEFADSLRILGIAVEVKRTLIGRVW